MKTKMKSVNFSSQTIMCNVCGKSRYLSGHPKCSRIRQQKFKAVNNEQSTPSILKDKKA